MENLLLGVESCMLETMREYQQTHEDRLLEAIERLEVRVEEMNKNKKPSLWARLWKW